MNTLEKILPINPELEDREDTEPAAKAEIVKRAGSTIEVATNAINWLKRRESELEAVKAKYLPVLEEIENEIKFHAQKVEFAKKVLTIVFPPGPDTDIVTETGAFYYSPSYATEIFDPEAIPLDCLDYPPPKPSVEKIKERWKEKKEVPGARQVVNWNLRMAAGGKRGEHNRAQREKKRQEREVEIG